MRFNKKNYIKILKYLKKNKYKFIPAYKWEKFKNKKKIIILRHDIDFETYYALEIAKIEKKEKIISNYFFLLRDVFYDLFSDETKKNIIQIKKLNHKIGAHINPETYKRKKQLNKEIKYFFDFYNLNYFIISYHQPRIYRISHLKLDYDFDSYNKKIMSHYRYFSDSSMNFDYKSLKIAIKNNENIQLLIHPIWWITKSSLLEDKVRSSMNIKINKIIFSYKQYLNKIKKINKNEKS